MGYDTRRYWNNKEKRAEKAREHTQLMEYYYGDEIKDVVEFDTKEYNDGFEINHPTFTSEHTEFILEDTDSVSAILKYTPEFDEKHLYYTAVLNFASYKNPGGQFINGSKAQEECLCHESYLYNVLKGRIGYYKINHKNKNRSLYTDRALYSPNVRFTKECKDVFCDVITCAAPNKTAAQKYCNVSDEENSKVLKERIEFILKIAQDNGVDNLILGAYGCGVFGQDPLEVAKIFKEFLSGKYKCFNKVIFAIPNKLEVNYRCFQKIFK